MEEEAYYLYIVKEVYPHITKVSAFCALFVVLAMIGLTIYDRRLVDRVTLRLQTGIAIYDIWFHTAPLWMTFYNKDANPMCTFIAWQKIFLALVYYFLNISIGLNLQLVFLHNVTITRMIEIAYWVVPLSLAFLISIVPLALGILGYSEENGCFVSGDTFRSKMVDAFAIEMWAIFAMLYLVIVAVLVLLSLNKKKSKIAKHKLLVSSGSTDRALLSVKLMGYRIILYPLVMILTQVGTAASQIYYDIYPTSMYSLDGWAFVSSSLTGTLNFIAFCCDPTVHSAITKIYKRVQFKKVLKFVPNESDSTQSFQMALRPRESQAFEIVNEEPVNTDDTIQDENVSNLMRIL